MAKHRKQATRPDYRSVLQATATVVDYLHEAQGTRPPTGYALVYAQEADAHETLDEGTPEVNAALRVLLQVTAHEHPRYQFRQFVPQFD